MSTVESRGSLRGYRRRKNVLDLNIPPSEFCSTREQEGTSQQVGSQQPSSQPLQSVLPATIDVEAIEAIDDDVIESSASAFVEAAKNNSRRRRGGRTDPVLVDLESDRLSSSSNNNQNRRRRHPPSQPVINCDHYINLESTPQSMGKETTKCQPPQKEPTFKCPICLGQLVQETSTRCGHIFCRECIKGAISRQAKCPTCRKRVTAKDLIRVFLPQAEYELQPQLVTDNTNCP